MSFTVFAVDESATWTAAMVLLDALLKGAVLLAFAWLVARPPLARSAATRHLIWSVALIGTLILPILTACLPRWPVAVLPAIRAGDPAASPVLAEAPDTTSERIERDQVEAVSSAVTPLPMTAHRRTPLASESARFSGEVSAEGAGSPESEPWAMGLLLVWGLGALAVLARLGMHVRRAAKLCRGAQLVRDTSWVSACEEARQRLGLRREVVLLASTSAVIPILWSGLFGRRPCVILPAETGDWSEGRRRMVLLHELAHASRRDDSIHLLSGFLCALYWPNPLMWLGRRRIKGEGELASDDLVLRAGCRASDYADQLLQIAGYVAETCVVRGAALAMASAGRLEGRIQAVLDPGRRRHPLSRPAVVFAALLATAIGLPLAMVRAVPGTNRAETDDVIPSAVESESSAPLWGEPVEGLQAGLVIRLRNSTRRLLEAIGHEIAPGRVECLNGEEVSAVVVVRNVSEHPIAFTKAGFDFPEGVAVDDKGRSYSIAGLTSTRQAFQDRYMLAPGTQIQLKAAGFIFAKDDYRGASYRGSRKLTAGPGVEYQIHYRLSNRGATGERREGEWIGELKTGSFRLGLAVLPDPENLPEPLVRRTPRIPAASPAPPRESDRREIAWGPTVNALRAGILNPGLETTELGEMIRTTVVLRNVGDGAKNLLWTPRIDRVGAWFLFTSDGEEVRARGASDHMTAKPQPVTIQPGQEVTFSAPQFAVVETDNIGWYRPVARTGPGDFEAEFRIWLQSASTPTKIAREPVVTGRRKLRVAPRTPHRLVGERAENFRLPLLDGSTFELARHRGKDVVVLYFWSSKNSRTHPGANWISQLAQQTKDKPVRVLGVNDRDTAEVASEWVRGRGYAFEVALDRDRTVHYLFDVYELPFPTIVIIDKDGIVRHALFYYRDASKLAAAVEALL